MEPNDKIPIGKSAKTPAQRYIRTFEGDRETLEKGGVPDLTPLVGGESESETPSKFTQTGPGEVPKSPPTPPNPSPLVPAPVPEPPPPAPIPTLLPKPPPTAEKSAPLETYGQDFSDRMKAQNASAVTILAAEEDAAPAPVTPMPRRESRGSVWYVIGGLVLVLIGVGGAYFAYTHYLSTMAPVVLAPGVSAPIFVDERALVTGTSTILLEQILNSQMQPLRDGAVRFLYEVNSTTTDNSVFSALILPAPGILLRNITAQGSMAGIVNAGGSQYPFFILSVASYGDTFAGMLAWEPLMPRDLASLFPPIAPATTTTATSTTATSTSKTTGKTATTSVPVAPPPGFKDEVISNHDARVYRDSTGTALIVYGYWNQKTLVIARDTAAFTELLNRLATSRAQP